METGRNLLDVEVVNSEKILQKRLVLPTFKDVIIYDEPQCAVLTYKRQSLCNKPFYLGFTILELSKTVLYEFHYDVMKKRYGKNVSLLYLDTDSFFYAVHTDDFYKDITDPELSPYFDDSDFSLRQPCYSSSKKVLKKFKEKCKNAPITEFTGIREKLFSFKTKTDNV